MKFEHVEELLGGYQTCLRCNVMFTPRKSVGQWQCYQHTGRRDPETGQWSCCQSRADISPLSPGCQPCDHGPQGGRAWRPSEVWGPLPQRWAERLGIPARAQIPAGHVGKHSLVVIQRVSRAPRDLEGRSPVSCV